MRLKDVSKLSKFKQSKIYASPSQSDAAKQFNPRELILTRIASKERKSLSRFARSSGYRHLGVKRWPGFKIKKVRKGKLASNGERNAKLRRRRAP